MTFANIKRPSKTYKYALADNMGPSGPCLYSTMRATLRVVNRQLVV